MASRTAARSPSPTRAGGQDDGANYQIPESIFLGSDVTPASESEFRADETSLSKAGVTPGVPPVLPPLRKVNLARTKHHFPKQG